MSKKSVPAKKASALVAKVKAAVKKVAPHKAEEPKRVVAVVPKAAVKEAHDPIVPLDDLVAACEKLLATRQQVEAEAPDLIPQWNEAFRGIKNLENACEARKQRILQEARWKAQVEEDKKADAKAKE